MVSRLQIADVDAADKKFGSSFPAWTPPSPPNSRVHFKLLRSQRQRLPWRFRRKRRIITPALQVPLFGHRIAVISPKASGCRFVTFVIVGIAKEPARRAMLDSSGRHRIASYMYNASYTPPTTILPSWNRLVLLAVVLLAEEFPASGQQSHLQSHRSNSRT